MKIEILNKLKKLFNIRYKINKIYIPFNLHFKIPKKYNKLENKKKNDLIK